MTGSRMMQTTREVCRRTRLRGVDGWGDPVVAETIRRRADLHAGRGTTAMDSFDIDRATGQMSVAKAPLDHDD